jgi:hypothetical protein
MLILGPDRDAAYVPCPVCSAELCCPVVHTAPTCEPGKAAFATSNKEYEDAMRFFNGPA